MTPLDVACIQPSDTFDYSQRMEALSQGPHDVSFAQYKPHRGDRLPDHGAHDATVVTGSEAHLYHRDEWQDDVQAYLADALGDDHPLLGVCYGHQAVADAAGGTVAALGDAAFLDDRELGYRQIAQTPAGREDPLFDGIPDAFVSFTSHLDHVAALPDDATVLATNDYGIQAFTLDDATAYGIQFHPEYDAAWARALIAGKDLDAAARDDALASVAAHADDATAARQVFRNFVATAADQ